MPEKNSIQHALNCKVGGLVATWHNEIQNKLVRVSMQAYSKSAVHNEHYINYGCKHSNNTAAGSSPVTVFPTLTDEDRKLWGDISIQGLWWRQMEATFDVRVTNLDPKSYLPKTAKKCLGDQEKEKKDKYLKLCMEQRKDFTLFVHTVDGVLAREAKMTLKQIVQALAKSGVAITHTHKTM
eukprot:9328134-Ditylum_brightwellii.AAC.1